jgi:hypothetical protein
MILSEILVALCSNLINFLYVIAILLIGIDDVIPKNIYYVMW